MLLPNQFQEELLKKLTKDVPMAFPRKLSEEFDKIGRMF